MITFLKVGGGGVMISSRFQSGGGGGNDMITSFKGGRVMI